MLTVTFSSVLYNQNQLMGYKLFSTAHGSSIPSELLDLRHSPHEANKYLILRNASSRSESQPSHDTNEMQHIIVCFVASRGYNRYSSSVARMCKQTCTGKVEFNP